MCNELIFPPVLTKRDFVQRYSNNPSEFGNCSPTWNTLEEWIRDISYSASLWHIRNRVAGGPTYYNIYTCNVGHYWRKCLHNGATLDSLYISEMAPTQRTLIQGELMQSTDSLTLYYSTLKKPMRNALREGGQEARGIIVSRLLQYYLCPRSYEWLQVLLERYPDHVIEFSTYACEFGTVPGYNTCFWEVRRY